ncbi:MAG: BON domain-containing protein [Ktedonobacteraceae bacterium]|nr:BON domain-containing protein [Ktedonobacteraceae bacterium]
MEKSTLISEMQKFQFGRKIFCSDGEEGTLTHVGFDPATRRMNSIGVKQSRPFGKTFFSPYNTVIDATGDGITLNVTRDELEASKNQIEGVLLDAKSTVQQADSSAKGQLLLVAIHPETGELAYCVARHLRPGQSTLVQQQYVTAIEPGRILISIPDAIFQTLPPYRSDAELQQEVEDILFDLTPLHVDFKGMNVRVLDSVLYLDGNISSSLRGDIVQDQALGVTGLLEVKNRLVGDDLLANDLARTLSRDTRTRDLPIGVYPRLGDVRLSGAVRTPEQKVAAGEVAANFPGVRSVINDLVVNPKADMLHVMSSAEGGEAEDIVPGRYIRHTK